MHPGNAPSPSSPRRVAWVIVVAATTAAVVAYVPSLSGEFQFDDHDFVEAGEAAKDPGAMVRTLLAGVRPGPRPLTDLSLALDHAVGGLDPTHYHATNLLLHLATTVLVFLFARATFRRTGIEQPEILGAIVAALHALHPIQTQAVSYVSQRSEVLASLLYLAVVLLLARAEEHPSRFSGRLAWAGACAAFVLGLGAKPVIVTAPAAWLLWSHAFDPSRRKLVKRVLAAAPLLGLGALGAFVMLRATKGDLNAGFQIPGLPPWRYALTQLSVIPRYVQLLAWPAGQSVDHDHALATWPPAAETVVGGVLLIAAITGAVAVLRRTPGETSPVTRVAGFGVLWFLLLLAPSSSVIPLRDAMVEHRLYLASFGLFAAALALGAHVSLRVGARGIHSAAIVLLAIGALGWATARRNEVWRTQLALWSDVVAKAPGLARGHLNLGFALDRAGDLRGAVEEYRRAVSLVDASTPHDLEVYQDLAGALRDLGRCSEARAVLDAAIPMAPMDPELQTDLAVCLAEAGDTDAALAAARRATTYARGDPATHNVLAYVLLLRNDPTAALEELMVALRLAPGYPPAVLNTATAREQLGDGMGACAALREYLQLAAGRAAQANARERFVRLGCR